MKLVSLLFFILFVDLLSAQDPYTLNLECQGSFDESITIIFSDSDPINEFYTDGQDPLGFYAGVEIGDTATWQFQPFGFADFSNMAKLIKAADGKYYFKFIPKDYFSSVPSGAIVTGINVVIVNKFGGGGNNQTNNLFIDLIPNLPSNITVFPTYPSEEDSITVTFDATGTVLDSASKVYFHSGISLAKTNKNSFDKSVGVWGADNGIGEMTPIGNKQWQIGLSSINSYYNLLSYQDAFGLNFVFRDAIGSAIVKNGSSDIYQPISTGPYLTFATPKQDFSLVTTGSKALFNAASHESETHIWTLRELDSLGAVIDTLFYPRDAMNFVDSVAITTIGNRYLELICQVDGAVKNRLFTLRGINSTIESTLPQGTRPGINYPSDSTTAILVLHLPTTTNYIRDNVVVGTGSAPDKTAVYAIGDFNNWEVDEDYRLKKDGDLWWITIENLIPGKEYIFQYLVDGLFKVADPYSTKISDPDDAAIGADRYEGLLPYPFDKTEKRASVLQTNKTPYQWKYSDAFVRPDQTELNIYELHFRDFTYEGTFKAAIRKLDYLTGLGINCIHMMPVSEFEGNSSWGYNPNFYFAVDKYYGTTDDLKEFIDEAHRRGMAVINDLVLNHAFKSNPMVRLYAEDPNVGNVIPLPNNPWFNHDYPAIYQTAGHWGADWNHESEHTQNFVDSVIYYWLTEFKLDGFRFDFTKGFTQLPRLGISDDPWASNYNAYRLPLLKRMKDRQIERHPGTYVIFEHLAEKSENKELADYGIMHWSGVGPQKQYKELALGFNNGTNLYSSVYNANEVGPFNEPHYISYIESHDEERLAVEVLQYGKNIANLSSGPSKTAAMLERVKMASLINAFLRGPRMIWQFEELGYDYPINYNGRTGEKPVHWEYYTDSVRRELYDLYALVFNLRNTQDLYGNYQYVHLGENGLYQPIHMKFKNSQLIVVANFDPDNAHSLTPGYSQTGKWYRYSNNTAHEDSMIVTDINSDYNIPINTFVIFSTTPLIVPQPLPEMPSKLLATSDSQTPSPVSIDIGLNDFQDSVVLVYHTMPHFIHPPLDVLVGDTLSNGSIVLMMDTSSHYSHDDYPSTDTLYYAIWTIKNGAFSQNSVSTSIALPPCYDILNVSDLNQDLHKSNLKLISSEELSVGRTVYFISQEIQLLPGFHVPLQTLFEVIIGDCADIIDEP